MSEQKTSSFMAELNQWTETEIINPLSKVFAEIETDGPVCDIACAAAKRAIREKVLQSYKNGLAAGQRRSTPTQKGGR